MTHDVQTPINAEERRNLDIRAGDTVKVWQKIQEKGKTRLQAFEGLVLARKHGNEPGATFTVRRVSGGTGVEKIFPLYSPMIDKIELVKRAKVRRAKLYYIREKVAKEIKRQMRNARFMFTATKSDTEEKARIEREKVEAEEKAQKEAEEKAAKEAEEKAKEEAKAAEEAAAKEEVPAAEETPSEEESKEETPAEAEESTEAEDAPEGAEEEKKG